MTISFLTTSRIVNINHSGIYTELMRKFRDEGHDVYIVTPMERRYGNHTELVEENGVKILKVWMPNIQKTSSIEKGISTLIVETLYKRAIKKYFKGVSFDLILYSTPPITFNNLVGYLKKKNPASRSYLLLKDIFPQNAVDLGMFGEESLLYRYFRRKEKALYQISDYIGCMSPANAEYVKKHNPEYPQDRVEIAPNSFEAVEMPKVDRNKMREEHGLPLDKTLFIYGGNLGRPQGVDFIIKCLEANKNREDCFFLIVGSGMEYHKMESWINAHCPQNVRLMKSVSHEVYNQLVSASDIGLLFLDHRFTIPNFPSRLLDYMINGKPIIAATDVVCDVGKIAEENHFGFWCESNNVEQFTDCVDKCVEDREIIEEMGKNAYQYFFNNYTVEVTYNAIMKHF